MEGRLYDTRVFSAARRRTRHEHNQTQASKVPVELGKTKELAFQPDSPRSKVIVRSTPGSQRTAQVSGGQMTESEKLQVELMSQEGDLQIIEQPTVTLYIGEQRFRGLAKRLPTLYLTPLRLGCEMSTK
jgi:hypothetical protein